MVLFFVFASSIFFIYVLSFFIRLRFGQQTAQKVALFCFFSFQEGYWSWFLGPYNCPLQFSLLKFNIMNQTPRLITSRIKSLIAGIFIVFYRFDTDLKMLVNDILLRKFYSSSISLHLYCIS